MPPATAGGTHDPEARARQICLRLLTAGPKTRAQLAQALHRGGVPAEAAETVLSRFADVRLIDDAAFARAWVESRHYSRGLSRRSLSAELRRHGVQNEEIREAVDTLDPEQEIATARRLVERKMESTRGRPTETRVRQAAGMLARKGYPPGLAFRLIKEVMQEAHKKGLLKKVTSGEASDAEAKKLLELYTELSKSKPPAGDADAFKATTKKMIEGAKLVVDGKKDEGIALLKKSVNCGGCHKNFKG